MAYICADIQGKITKFFQDGRPAAMQVEIAEFYNNHMTLAKNSGQREVGCLSCHVHWLKEERRSKDLVFPNPCPADEEPSSEPSSAP